MGAAGGACIRCRERHAPALDGVGVRGSKRRRSAHATCAPFRVGAASRPASEHGERGSGSGPSPRRIEGRRGGADVHGSVGAALIALFACDPVRRSLRFGSHPHAFRTRPWRIRACLATSMARDGGAHRSETHGRRRTSHHVERCAVETRPSAMEGMLRARWRTCVRAWTLRRGRSSQHVPAAGEEGEASADGKGRWRPYVELARLHRPSGALLLLWPCLYGASMATEVGHHPDGRVVAAMAVGATLMRGSGCAANDATDADVDRLVARTRSRPVARGAIEPRQAWCAAGAMAAVAGASTCLLAPSALLPALAATPLAALYPRAKRIFHYPQAFLGLAFSCGAPVGYAAQRASSMPCSWIPSWEVWWSGWNALDAQAWSVVAPLMGHCVLWTLAYDTVYAFQDRKDDAKVGVGSAALRIGGEGRGKATLMAWSASSAWMLAMAMERSDTMHAPGMAALAAYVAHGAWQAYTLDANDPRRCDLVFRSHAWLGLVVFLGLVADRAWCGKKEMVDQRSPPETPTSTGVKAR